MHFINKNELPEISEDLVRLWDDLGEEPEHLIQHAYLAGNIFNESGRMYLDYIADKIKSFWPELDLYVPHRNASINDKTKCAGSKEIYEADMERLKKADLLIAVVSGDLPPIGTTCEIGIYTQLQEQNPNKKLLCLYDDNRNGSTTFSEEKVERLKSDIAENQWHYFNLFLTGCIKAHGKMFNTSEELFKGVLACKNLTK